MQHSPIILVFAAGLLTLGVSQTLSPTVHAETVPAVPALRVFVQSLHVKQTLGGMEVTGKIVNTGQQALTYPAVACVFTDAAGAEIEHADGYLTAGPVAPGQGARFRAMTPTTPHYAKIILRLREAGHPVAIQPSASRCTTVR